MFRTIVVRSDLAREVVRKAVRGKLLRSVTVECAKRRNYHR